MSDDLVKRLLASRSVWTNENGRAECCPSDLEMEAAAALLAKDAENARLRELLDALAFTGKTMQAWTDLDVALNPNGAAATIATVGARLAALENRDG